MSDSTLNSASFTVTTNTGVAVAGSVTVTDNTATFVPSVNLDANTQYTATISTAAIDSTGNALADNYSWSFTTAAATEGGTAILSWDPVTATDLSGYRVYYGTGPGAYLQPFGHGIEVGDVVTYTVTGLSSGTRYYFAVTAYDTTGNESIYSNEVFKDSP
jgi:fibronectin type 3 domain-containing protein